MNLNTLLYAEDEGVAHITLNRPKVLNAITDEMCLELMQTVERASAPGVRAVLLTGAGRAFSSGADLGDKAVDSDGSDLLERFDRLFNPLIIALRGLPKPVVAAVNGPAVGYACALALCADIVIASEDAFFLTAAASAGIMPDGGLTALLPAFLGPARAAAMVLNGERLGAEQAVSIGAISRCCAPHELRTLSTDIASRLAMGPTRTFAATKQAFNAQLFPTLQRQLQLEGELQQRLSETHDYREGTTAFVERRQPQFVGR